MLMGVITITTYDQKYGPVLRNSPQKCPFVDPGNLE